MQSWATIMSAHKMHVLFCSLSKTAAQPASTAVPAPAMVNATAQPLVLHAHQYTNVDDIMP